MRHLPQGAGEPVPVDPPAECGGGRGHSPVGERLQDRQPRGGAAGAPGEPRPGHRGAGARTGDREDQVLLPAGLCVQHHRERHGHHAARAADGEALPEPPAAARASRARHDLPATGFLPGADPQGDLADQHHGRVQGELQQHHVLRLSRCLLAGQPGHGHPCVRSEPPDPEKTQPPAGPTRPHGEGLVPPCHELGPPRPCGQVQHQSRVSQGVPPEPSPRPAPGMDLLPREHCRHPHVQTAGAGASGRSGLPAEGVLCVQNQPRRQRPGGLRLKLQQWRISQFH